MNTSVEAAGVRPRPRRPRDGRPGPGTFCWCAIMNIPTRRPVYTRCVGRDWRVLLVDPMP